MSSTGPGTATVSTARRPRRTPGVRWIDGDGALDAVAVVAGFRETTVGDTITDPLHLDALPVMQAITARAVTSFLIFISPDY